MKTRRSVIPVAVATTFAGLLGTGAGLSLTAHAASAVVKYVFAPSPIAASGSLAAGATVAVTVTPEGATNNPVPGATVFLSFNPASGGGSAKVNGTPPKALTTTPTAYTADGSGHIALTYKAPSPLPCGGVDSINAQDAATGAKTHKTDTYNFSTVGRYGLNPVPIAPPASLAKGASVAVTVTAINKSGAAIACATIFLSLHPTGSGLGTAKVGTTALTATPQGFHANASGQVAVTYTASTAATLPTAGSDDLVAQNAATNASKTAVDAYSYGTAAAYAFTPSPIAPAHSLPANTNVKVSLKVTDSSGAPVAGAKVYLLFTNSASGGGSAAVSGHALNGVTAVGAFSDSFGIVTMIYTTPSTLPPSGTDTLKGQNKGSSPTITATDAYTF